MRTRLEIITPYGVLGSILAILGNLRVLLGGKRPVSFFHHSPKASQVQESIIVELIQLCHDLSFRRDVPVTLRHPEAISEFSSLDNNVLYTLAVISLSQEVT